MSKFNLVPFDEGNPAPYALKKAAGGIVGTLSDSAIIDSYAACLIASPYVDKICGGIIGACVEGSTIDNCYVNARVSSVQYGGGIAGTLEDGSLVSDSYYDEDISGQNDVGKGTPLSWAELTDPDTYDWDPIIWTLETGRYPYHANYESASTLAPPTNVTVVPVADTSINVWWEAPLAGTPTGYGIYIRKADVGYVFDGSTNATLPTSESPYVIDVIPWSATTLEISVCAIYTLNDVTVNGPMSKVNIIAATPTISPRTGSYASSVTATITSGTGDASIYYTTDGSDPTSGSALYTEPITISVSSIVKAIAIRDGYVDSSIQTVTYAISKTPALPQPNSIIRAWGMRRNIAGYAGPALREWRTSGGTETDKYFNDEGIIEISGVSAFAKTLYDQKDGPDLTSEFANSPKIYDEGTGLYSGVLLQDNTDQLQAAPATGADATLDAAMNNCETNGVSISVWFRFSGSATSPYQYKSSAGFLSIYIDSTKYLRIYFRNGTAISVIATPMPTDTWINVIMAVQSDIKAYINGVWKKTAAYGTVTPGTTNHKIGGVGSGTIEVNDIVIWNALLSEDDVVTVFNAQCGYYGVAPI